MPILIKIFKNISNKRLDEIEELSNKTNYDNLAFIAKNSGKETDFTAVEDPIVFLDNIRTNKITIERAKNLQEEFKTTTTTTTTI